MQIAISGSTGFIGTALARACREKGWSVVPLSRQDLRQDSTALAHTLEGCAAVVNLAGAPIAARWTTAYKKVLYDSRIETTRSLVSALSLLRQKPEAFISACGIGIYSSRGVHTEDDKDYADDFLGILARDWEQEALAAQAAGVRTVVFRFGVVLGSGGGALQRMLLPFRLGLGGRIGSGGQAFSWVHIHDLLRAVFRAVDDSGMEGAYNLTAPHPTTNGGLTRALGRALRRPALLPVPGFAVKLLFGEGATILLEGQTVLPKRLLERGFTFTFTTIEGALADLLQGTPGQAEKT